MEAPRKIGKYEILERIGRGGFGFVYKARDPFIKRLVAVKVCTSPDETLKKRFLREAEIAGNLHHRNIVTVFELGYDDAGPFLIQEYLPGENLEAKIRRRDDVSYETKLRYLLQIARALEYAQKKGVLHRDIKPANVGVLEDGRVKLLDFGIAKLAGAETQLTRTGKVVGTAGYLSPEQLRGEPVDARCDIFSFGVLAYELLSYEHPFPGTTISELIQQVVHSEPSPLPVAWPACPPEIAGMIARCMEKDPARRYDGFPEVAELLAATVAELDSTGVRGFLPTGETTRAPGNRSVVQDLRRYSPDTTSPSPAGKDLEATQFVDEIPRTPTPPAPAPAAREEPRPERTAPVLGGDWSLESKRDDLVHRLALGAGVALLVLLAGAVVWWIAHTPQADPVRDGSAGSGTAPGTEATVVVEAVPWGRLQQVTDSSGDTVPLPAETTTPLTLRLDAGEYTLELVHPEAEEPESCTVWVAEGKTGHCRVELVRLDPFEYFREAGWWE